MKYNKERGKQHRCVDTYIRAYEVTDKCTSSSKSSNEGFIYTHGQTDRQRNIGREMNIVKSKYETKCLISSIKILR